MANVSGPVLIIDNRREVLELNRILLAAEGYEAEGYTYEEAPLERLRLQQPRVLLLDLAPGDEAAWMLLRRLRQDDLTREIGVVVTSDVPSLVERALHQSDLGVAAGLVMPFDIEALYQAIETAERHSNPAQTVDTMLPLLQHAAEVVRQGRQRILVRWVQRLSSLDAFRRQPDLSLAAVQGQGDTLIASVAEVLALHASARVIPAIGTGLPVQALREHACLRREQGLTGSDVARELTLLRRELWRALRNDLGRKLPSLDDIWNLQGRLFSLLDQALFIMLDIMEEKATS